MRGVELGPEEDLHRGSRLSALTGFASAGLTVSAVVFLLLGRWKGAIIAFLVAQISAYLSYRLVGGRKNPVLLREHIKALLSKKGFINPLTDLWTPWADGVRVLFETLEKETGGRYSLAIDLLRVRSSSPRLMSAYSAARANPTQQNWTSLRDEMASNPPHRVGRFYRW